MVRDKIESIVAIIGFVFGLFIELMIMLVKTVATYIGAIIMLVGITIFIVIRRIFRFIKRIITNDN